MPVIVLLHGSPGGSDDWVKKNVLAQMDTYAAAHEGLAPIVVMPDLSGNGGPLPLCLDTSLGKSATYLAQDVPSWAKRVLGAGRAGSRQWAIAGFSYGGTCSMQLATTHPDVYPTFLDLLGEDRAASNTPRDALVASYFGGDDAAFGAQNALDVLRARPGSLSGSKGKVVVGSDDDTYGPQGREVYRAMKTAAVDVELQVADGSHTWDTSQPALTRNLPWLAQRLGMVGP